MGEEWGRGRHVNHIGITLETRHEGGFQKGGFIVVPLLALAVTGILAGKDLRTLAVVRVVTQSMRQEPLLVTIVVFVHQVSLLGFHGFPTVFEAVGVVGHVLRNRTAGAHNLDVGIFGADGSHEGLQTLVVELAPLLVAHTDILHVEGLRVSHVGTYLTPFRVGRTIGEFDEVQTVVDVGLQLVHGNMSRFLLPVLILAGQTYAQDGQRFCTNVL